MTKDISKCDSCKYKMRGTDEMPCIRCINQAMDKYEPETNADRIRRMNDEDLAEFIDRAKFCGGLIAYEQSSELCKGCSLPFCSNGPIINWLREKAGGNDAS